LLPYQQASARKQINDGGHEKREKGGGSCSCAAPAAFAACECTANTEYNSWEGVSDL